MKYKIVRDELLRAIRAGEFKAGQWLPTERELAARFKVTHMTVRRAVAELVDAELLERRSPLGIYIRDHSQEKLSTITLNLICSVSDSSVTSDFLKFGTQYATQRGWRTRITRSYEGYEGPLARVVKAGEPSVIFLDLPGLSPSIRSAMVHSNGRAVLIGNRFDDPRVPSVMADDKLAMEMAIAHLRQAGHENIAFMVHSPEHPVVSGQVATWKAHFADTVSPEVLERRLIIVPVVDFQNGAETGYATAKKYFQRPVADADATAIIVINDMFLFGAISACQESGRRVPEDVSFICTMDSFVLKLLISGTTAINICMEQHIKYALEMIDAAMADELPADGRFRLVQPELVSRNSVKPCLPSRTKNRELARS